ncbi:hypothetical protein B0H13DRAFT_2316561 [Mycena leptocephala]|nr:hypothetical protein B0H13DRAFT_2316561 [Mycena leptocephala]
MLRTLLAISLLHTAALSSPFGLDSIHSRASEDDVVLTSEKEFCMIMPRSDHTNIGDSKHPGGMASYCSSATHSSKQKGTVPDNLWRNVEFKTGSGKNGEKYAQAPVTGCIRVAQISQLDADGYGGQYDSNGSGNPEGSKCKGYKHYIELIEPSDERGCVRCCNDPVDCPTTEDTQGCPNMIPGNYFDCT